MILSMTGFGHAVTETDIGQLSVSIRSVNSRYLDIKIRGLNLEPLIEKDIRELISSKLVRGSVQLFYELIIGSPSINSFSFNKERFEAIDDTLKMISKKYSYDINPGDFIHTSDLLSDGRLENINKDDTLKITNDAIFQLNEMRESEGNKICKDISSRLNTLKKGVKSIEKVNISFAKNRKDKLQKRLEKLLGDFPDTRIVGSELVPYDPEGPEHQGAITRIKDITAWRCYSYIISFLVKPLMSGRRAHTAQFVARMDTGVATQNALGHREQ